TGAALGHERAAGPERREREAAREPLRGDDDVGLHGEVLVAPELTGAAIPGLHFVDDEEDPVAIAALPEPAHELGVGGDVAALPLDGFDDHRGRLVGGTISDEDVIELPQAELGRRLFVPTIAVRMREGRDDD